MGHTVSPEYSCRDQLNLFNNYRLDFFSVADLLDTDVALRVHKLLGGRREIVGNIGPSMMYEI